MRPIAIRILGGLILAAMLGMALAVFPTEKKSPCADPLGCVAIGPDEPVSIGVIESLTGEVAILGKEQVRGLELALDRRQGRILGHAVELRIEDTGCRPEGGANAALRIVSDPAVVESHQQRRALVVTRPDGDNSRMLAHLARNLSAKRRRARETEAGVAVVATG